MTTHEMIETAATRARDITKWQCTRCAHAETIRVAPDGSHGVRVVLARGDEDADHDGAAALVEDETVHGPAVLPELGGGGGWFGAIVDRLREGL